MKLRSPQSAPDLRSTQIRPPEKGTVNHRQTSPPATNFDLWAFASAAR